MADELLDEMLSRATTIDHPKTRYPEELPLANEFLGRVRNPLNLIQEIAGSPLGMLMLGAITGGSLPRSRPLSTPSPTTSAKPLGLLDPEFTPIGDEAIFNNQFPPKTFPNPVEAVYHKILAKGGK